MSSISYVIEDSSFILAVLDSGDALHQDAIYTFNELSKRKSYIKIIIPPLVLYEVIVVLRRKGVTSVKIENTLMRMVNIDNVCVFAISEMSAFKHAKHTLNSTDQNKALRTSDFLIFCVADELHGSILTFDKKLHDRCKTVYPHVYYCSSQGGMTDETRDFLQHVDKDAGLDVSKIEYQSF
jgi:predicted nucleic acid-binding protein